MKRALIIGHTGQDGSYLMENLKGMHYEILGVSGKKIYSDNPHFKNILSVTNKEDAEFMIKEFRPDEVYYVAAVHHASTDKRTDDGELFRKSFDVNVTGVTNLLEAIRQFLPSARFFYAASSHVFGIAPDIKQNEETPKNPICVYGISKLAGMNACRYYRDTHGIFACSGIFYNHESPLREPKYVSMKIVQAAVAIRNKQKSELVLGNLDARIDWGYADDYTKAAIHMLSLNSAQDFIISSGEQHSIAEFVNEVFSLLQLDPGQYVRVDSSLITKAPNRNLFGDNSRLLATGWKPNVNFKGLVKLLTEAELKKQSVNASPNKA